MKWLAVVVAAGALATPAYAQRTAPSHLKPRSQMGTMLIPRIHLTTPIFVGSQQMYQTGVNWPPELNGGPAWYPPLCEELAGKQCLKWFRTPLPWQPGTVTFAGHRVTHTHPFRWLNLLKKGDSIFILTRWGNFHYQVRATEVVSPDATWVLSWGGQKGHRLVLTACNPPHQSTTRIVVFAQRV